MRILTCFYITGTPDNIKHSNCKLSVLKVNKLKDIYVLTYKVTQMVLIVLLSILTCFYITGTIPITVTLNIQIENLNFYRVC